MEERIKREHEKSQAALIGFLNIDLELAWTFLRIAQTGFGTDPNHPRSSLAKARDALRTIRRFQNHVEDPVASENIRSKADALEKALDAFAILN